MSIDRDPVSGKLWPCPHCWHACAILDTLLDLEGGEGPFCPVCDLEGIGPTAFVPGDFEILGPPGRSVVSGFLGDDLGVHSPAEDFWKITHLSSGCAFPAHFATRSQAVAAAIEIQPLSADWRTIKLDDIESIRRRSLPIVLRHGGVPTKAATL